MQRIISVANRLPVTIGSKISKSSGGLVAALEGVSNEDFKLLNVGWPGAVREGAEREQVAELLEQEYDCIPVFLDEDQVQGYYHGLSNSSLWPLLHYNRVYMNYAESDWLAYHEVNTLFAETILQHASDGDVVWVHDYHLMLLPEMLRAAKPSLKIGFFLHTPFPSSEMIRCHPKRKELLRGLLGADLVGFHTFGYLRHFRSSVLQILGYESEMTAIKMSSHTTSLGVFPIGINSDSFKKELVTKQHSEMLGQYRSNWQGKKLVLSVERLDYSKGILRRLEAIETYLAGSTDREDVVFLFVSVPTRGEVKEYQMLRENIERAVGRINGRYATIENSPIHFIHQSIPFTELCALYALADVALVTPLVDGMNLVAKEYIACQNLENPGVLVLSEFAGAAQELVNALIVNPYDKLEVANTIDQALHMERDERVRRMQYMQARVMHYDANYWAESFMNELNNCEAGDMQPVDMTVSEEAITTQLAKAVRPAFFLDYDGTLRDFEDKPDDAFPQDELKLLLSELDAAPIDVYIISGRNGDTLQEWFKDYNFTLIAEHGNRYHAANDSEWQVLNKSSDFSWQDRVLDIFELYEGSTPGSTIEMKESSVVWHYRQADAVYGNWKAKQLLSDMDSVLSNLPIEIHHGKRIVEVSSMYVNKGLAIEHFLKRKDYDFLLCAGDDQTDEAMFRLNNRDIVSVKVGDGDSHAANRVADVSQFLQLLQRLIKAVQSEKQGRSCAT